ncbi:hypothetical protein E3P96_02139 [Wallemia ichthyophaga]|nr:hypothetical protein E3P96_02139 [Wallemia ichthyophaga]
MSTLTVPIESVAAKGNTAVHTRTRSSSFIRALADVQPQGEHSETFSAPILSDNYTIPQLLDHHCKHSAKHISIITPNTCYSLADRAFAAYRGVAYLHESLQGLEPGSTVAFLAETEPVVYSTMVLAAMRAGYVPFPISSRNSIAAIGHLLTTTSCKHLLYTSTSGQLRNLAQSAASAVSAESGSTGMQMQMQLARMPTHDELYVNKGTRPTASTSPPPPDLCPSLDAPALIIHSSGSTNFPKPVRQTHRHVMQWGRVPYYGSSDVCSRIMFAGCLPTFHAMGVIFQIAIPLTTGMQVGCFQVLSPPTFPTAANILRGVRDLHANLVIAPASVIADWSGDGEAVETLRNLDAVMFGGSPLSEDVGDALVRQGVKLSNQYGSTECGHTTSFFTPPAPDWQYITLSPHTKPRFIADAGGGGVSELQFVACASHVPAVSNVGKVGNADESAISTQTYATNDLVKLHPRQPNRVRIVGRKDDQIMLLNGEKTNPTPLEMIIAESPHVSRAVMFGRGRRVNGVLVERESGESETHSHSRFVESIWMDIERANKMAPQHSRILPNYVLVADPNRPFPLTPKGSVKRAATLEQYAGDIDALYERESGDTNENKEGNVETTATITTQNAHQVVADILSDLLPGGQVDSTTHLFTQGCDSLLATLIHNRLRNALPGTHRGRLGKNVVFDHPRLGDLTRHVVALLNNKLATPSALLPKQDLQRMIRRYASGSWGRQVHNQTQTQMYYHTSPQQHVYLVTGTTGSLGSYLLSALVASTKCARVYAANRPHPSKTLVERQKAALRSRGLDESVADSSKVHLLEMDLGRPVTDVAGLDSVTHIIHNAWTVNFNLPLECFESDLASLRHLTELALSTAQPAHLTFLSSIGVLANWTRESVVPEEMVLNEDVALGLGYGESKYVGEMMLAAVSQQTGLKTSIIRSGQLAGSRTSGSWNDNEWLPSIIRSASSLGCLPEGGDDVAWLPVDTAAQAVLDISSSTCTTTSSVFSLTHPQPVSWNSVMMAAATRIGVPLVSYTEWLRRLDEVDSAATESELGNAMEKIPALKLKAFFSHSTLSPNKREFVEALGNPRLSTSRSCSVSETLKQCSELSESDMMKWMDYWGM